MNEKKTYDHLNTCRESFFIFILNKHPFMIKILHKISIEGTYLNLIQAIHNKPTENIILNGVKLKAFFLRSEKDKGAYSQHYHSTSFWKS